MPNVKVLNMQGAAVGEIALADDVSFGTVGICVLFVVLLGVLSGVIPSMQMSRFKPIDVVRGTFRYHSKMVLGRVFIVLQNVITLTLLTATLVIMLQIRFLVNAPMGFDSHNLVRISSFESSAVIADALRGLPCVKDIAFSQGTSLTGDMTSARILDDADGDKFYCYGMNVDTLYFRTTGIEVLKSYPDVSADGCYVNEAFLRRRKSAARAFKCAAGAAFAAFWLLTWNYLPYWETCEYMYSYVLARDEVPNWKVMGNSICTAFRSGNLEVIQDVATRMRRYHDVYKIPEAVADRTARFCLAHVAWLNQDRETARKMYHVLWPEAETVGWREFLWPDFVFPLFFRDMAQISVLEGKPDEAVEFLDRELQVRTPDDYQYFLAEAMKAQIRKDLPGQLKAWEKIVEMQPENRVYRMIYDELVQNSGNAPK